MIARIRLEYNNKQDNQKSYNKFMDHWYEKMRLLWKSGNHDTTMAMSNMNTAKSAEIQ